MRRLLILLGTLALVACSPITAPNSGEAIDAGGESIDATVVCDTSDECGGTTPICDEANSICQACSVRTECAGLGGGPECSSTGACVECTSDEHCTTPAAPFCGADESCRGCESNDECDSGACEFETGICTGLANVVYVGGTGAADVGTCTKTMPCNTFSYANNQLTALRHTLLLAPQTYTQRLVTAQLPLVRVIASGAKIDGSTVPPNQGNGLLETAFASQVSVEGLELVNAPQNAIYCSGNAGGTGPGSITLDNVSVDGAELSGLAHKDPCDAFLHGVTIRGSGQDSGSAAITWNGNKLEIDRSNIVANPNTAINVTNVAMLLQNSMITNNGSDNYNRIIRIANDVGGGGTAPVIVRFNTIAFNSPGCVATVEYSNTAQAVTFDSNIVYNNQATCGGNIEFVSGTNEPTNNIIEATASAGGGTPAGNVGDDPQFANAGSGDYSLKQSSVGIDKGTAAGAPSHDFRNNARPQGAGADIGAIESF